MGCKNCRFSADVSQTPQGIMLLRYGFPKDKLFCTVKAEALTNSFVFRDQFQEGRVAMLIQHTSVSPYESCEYYTNDGSGGSSNSGGCYIATAVYGGYDCPQVLILRRFRDDKLLASTTGRLFVKMYYALSPPVANKLKRAKKINSCARKILDWFVNILEQKQQ